MVLQVPGLGLYRPQTLYDERPINLGGTANPASPASPTTDGDARTRAIAAALLAGDSGDTTPTGKHFDQMTPDELQTEMANRQKVSDMLSFSLPKSGSEALMKGALLAMPGSFVGSLMAKGGMALTEKSMNKAYDNAFDPASIANLRRGNMTPIGLGPVNYYKAPGPSGGMAAPSGGMAAGGGGGSWGPQNSKADEMGLTGADYANAIADDPSIGSARYSADDIFGGDDANGGGGDTIICTELRRQGLIDNDLRRKCSEFGKKQHPDTFDGYHLWAAPIVHAMRRSPRLSRMVRAVFRPVMYQMADKASRGPALAALIAFSRAVGWTARQWRHAWA